MIEAPAPENEELRLAALRSCAVLDTPAEEAFDQITWLASYVCGAPIALVSLIDADRQWFKSRVGLTASETPRRIAFCSHAILGRDVFVVEDARADARFHDNPLVEGPPNIRFYAGAPLELAKGERVGTLCVIDRVPRQLTADQQQALRALASQVVAQLELRQSVAQLALTTEILAAQRKELAKDAQLLELAHSAVIVTDIANTIKFWNRGAEEMYGWSRKEAVGQVTHALLRTQFPVSVTEVEETLTRTGKWRGELVHMTRDGTPIIVSSRWAMQHDDAGHPLAIMEINNDITARKNAEKALRESEARVRSIVDNSLAAIITIDSAGTVLSFNPAAEQIFGYSADEIIGKNVETFVPGDEIEPKDFLQNVFWKSVGRVIECRAKRKNGDVFPAETALFEINTASKEFACGVVDISERQALEKMKDEFVATVSHELRTPLTSIRGALGLLAGGVLGRLPHEAAQAVAVAERNSVRLIHLINDILDIERLESGAVEMARETTRLAALVDRAVESVRAVADTRGIEITSSIAHETVLCDAERMVQVLVNLLSNAVKFSEPSSSVEVQAIELNGWTELRVRDHGRGIPSNALPMLFQRFRQVEAGDSRDRGGTGLGLAISKAIVEQNGGMIGVESREGEGSTFWVRLPRERRAGGDDESTGH